MAYGGMRGYGANPGKVVDANAIVDQVAKLLKECSFVIANEVVKGGSLGHGTTVPGHFDVDLVLYSKSITKEVMMTKGNQPGSARWWAQRLDNYFRSKMPGYERMGTVSEHGVQFRVPLQGGTMIKCDLLMSPWWADQKQYLQYVNGQVANGKLEETLKLFSASASKWQVELIEKLPNEVKELIRRAKRWRNDQWSSDKPDIGKPKSYLISVLVIHACWCYARQKGYESLERLVEREGFNTIATGVASLMRDNVQNHHKFRVSWGEQLEVYPRAEVPQPYILDPANPFNNMYKSGVGPYDPNSHFCEYAPGNGKWGPFVAKVRSLDLRA